VSGEYLKITSSKQKELALNLGPALNFFNTLPDQVRANSWQQSLQKQMSPHIAKGLQ
jgi:hypothetical protein